VVLIDHDHVDAPADDEVGASAGVPDPVDPLSGREAPELDVLSEHGTLLGVEQGEDRNGLEQRGLTGHRRSPPPPMMPQRPERISPPR
jgi:hypothetical protein